MAPSLAVGPLLVKDRIFNNSWSESSDALLSRINVNRTEWTAALPMAAVDSNESDTVIEAPTETKSWKKKSEEPPNSMPDHRIVVHCRTRRQLLGNIDKVRREINAKEDRPCDAVETAKLFVQSIDNHLETSPMKEWDEVWQSTELLRVYRTCLRVTVELAAKEPETQSLEALKGHLTDMESPLLRLPPVDRSVPINWALSLLNQYLPEGGIEAAWFLLNHLEQLDMDPLVIKTEVIRALRGADHAERIKNTYTLHVNYNMPLCPRTLPYVLDACDLDLTRFTTEVLAKNTHMCSRLFAMDVIIFRHLHANLKHRNVHNGITLARGIRQLLHCDAGNVYLSTFLGFYEIWMLFVHVAATHVEFKDDVEAQQRYVLKMLQEIGPGVVSKKTDISSQCIKAILTYFHDAPDAIGEPCCGWQDWALSTLFHDNVVAPPLNSESIQVCCWALFYTPETPEREAKRRSHVQNAPQKRDRQKSNWRAHKAQPEIYMPQETKTHLIRVLSDETKPLPPREAKFLEYCRKPRALSPNIKGVTYVQACIADVWHASVTPERVYRQWLHRFPRQTSYTIFDAAKHPRRMEVYDENGNCYFHDIFPQKVYLRPENIEERQEVFVVQSVLPPALRAYE